MRAPFTIVLLPLLATLPAPAEEFTPRTDFIIAQRITGQLIVDSMRPLASTASPADRALHRIYLDQSHGYLRALKDSARGNWCQPGSQANRDVDAAIASYLAGLSSAKRQEDATSVVAEALLAKFPCPQHAAASRLAGSDFIDAQNITAQMVVAAIRFRGTDKEQAFGYLRGITDMSNVRWCPPKWLGKLEIDSEIVAYLAKLPSDVREREAAPLVADAMRAKFPCNTSQEP